MKIITQISVFMENTTGRLAQILTQIGENGIDIRAISIADTNDFGILRFIPRDAEKAADILKNLNLVVKKTEVMAINMDDVPGGLAKTLSEVSKLGIDIQYMYAFSSIDSEEPTVVIKTADVKGDLEKLNKSAFFS